MSSPPPIRYTRTGDNVNLAYWSLGRGPVLIHSPNVQLSHAGAEWSVPGMHRWYEALARHFTVVRFDHRGGGLSGRDGGTQSIDALVDDVETISAETSPQPFVLLGWVSGGLPAIAYAARNPSRVSHLILWCSFARNEDHGLAPRMRALFQLATTDWELFTESISQAALGWRNADSAQRWAAVVRQATTPAEFFTFLQARREWDVADLLGHVSVPTLVLHDRTNALASEERSRELAAGIPSACLRICETADGAPGDDALEAILEHVGLGQGEASGLSELTPREREVLSLVVEGATNKEIAQRLFISVDTVTRHLTHIYEKTATRNRAQAVRYALERGLSDS